LTSGSTLRVFKLGWTKIAIQFMLGGLDEDEFNKI